MSVKIFKEEIIHFLLLVAESYNNEENSEKQIKIDKYTKFLEAVLNIDKEQESTFFIAFSAREDFEGFCNVLLILYYFQNSSINEKQTLDRGKYNSILENLVKTDFPTQEELALKKITEKELIKSKISLVKVGY